MSFQERIGETENELKILQAMENYDNELTYRIARSYMETRCYREARDIYLFLHENSPDKENAEECLYLAFRCSMAIQDWNRVFELGEKYMEKYPCGRNFDPLTIAMGQVYAKLQDWPEVIRHLTKTLEVNPKHEDGAECMFLLGYAYFMEENFEESTKWLTKMNKDYPGNPREMESIYWLGMSLLFSGKYDESGMEFDHLLQQFPTTPYKEDASFRRAVCDYGLSKYNEAGIFLNRFVSEFPKSKLTGEAYMMLADVAGVDGNLKKSVECYQEATSHEINIELYNYCIFRCGEMLFNDFKDYNRTIEHFQTYINRNLPGSNLPQAIYYIGSCYWQKGEKTGALEYFKKALEDYGNDKKAIGIDLILEEWIGKAKAAEKDIGEKAWLEFKTTMKKAKQDGKKVLALRLNRALFFEPNISEDEKKKILNDIVKAENVPFAGPGVLQLILDEAVKRGNSELSKITAEQMIESFTETDYALDARMYLATAAIKAKDYKTAEKHLNVIREVFASSGQAAEALNMLGKMYLENKEYEKAYDSFKPIIGVKEWKGPLWPAALYGMAEAQIGMKNLDKAIPLFERIYLMYSHYKNWAVKAYIKRAACLKEKRMYKEAAETLQHMLDDSDFKDLPEAEEAKKELDLLKGKI